MPTPRFISLLVQNFRTTFFIIVAVVGAVVGYALLMDEKAKWFVVIAVAVGMTLSSVFNAWRDSKREEMEQLEK